MNSFQQEWQTGNATIAFPFSSESAGFLIPSDFIADLRLFLTGTKVVEAFLSEVSYDETGDTYLIKFSRSDTGAVVLEGEISRLDGSGGERVGAQQFISSGEKVCLFTPGRSWNDNLWGGSGSWTQTFTADLATISQDVVNPGPPTFRRIFIEGHVPDESLWPRGGVQRLVGGYNIGFGSGSAKTLVPLPNSIDINAGGGLGAGYPPEPERVVDYLATFNGKGPDMKGNVNIVGADCLRTFQPRTESALIPNTVQVNSDCLPCCTCAEYRNSSRAIGRRSAKIKDLCDLIQRTIESSGIAHNIGVEAINRNRRPLAVVRNVRALGSTITFSVQNLTGLPIFVYVAFRIEASAYGFGTPVLDQPNIVVVSGGNGNNHVAITAHKATLPSMPYDVSENPLAGVPATNFSSAPSFLFCVGEKKLTGNFLPISPGGLIKARLTFPEIAAAIITATTPAGSVAAALPRLSFSSLAVYGSSKSFACAADQYRVQVIDNTETPDQFEECELPFAGSYNTIAV